MSTSSEEPTLTIGAVAAQTSVAIATLRAWETRYGFPVPTRVPSGHRRYSALQVEQIRQIVRDRDDGWSLEAAIVRAKASGRVSAESIFAGLRVRRPDLPVVQLSARAMLAVSHAIEDEYSALGEHAVLLGSFERVEFYRVAEDRWRELARTAAVTIVFADFAHSAVRKDGPTEVALRSDAPLLREWSVVCDSPGFAACLAGVERPSRRAGEARRVFEAVWSFEPDVVRAATEVGFALARAHAPRTRAMLDELPAWSGDAEAVLRRAGEIANRVVAYLDR
jgi:MerR family transcriptional regulator, light-induced transcriptional regulator